MKYCSIILFIFVCSCEKFTLNNILRKPASTLTVKSCLEEFRSIFGQVKYQKEAINWDRLISKVRGESDDVLSTFEQSIKNTFNKLDEHGKEFFLKRLRSIQENNVKLSVSYEKQTLIKSIYERFKIFNSKQLIIWPKSFKSEVEEFKFVLDSLYMANYSKMNLFNVYPFSRSRFTKDNVAALNDFLQIKFFLLSGKRDVLRPKNIPSLVLNKTARIISFFLPFELGKIGVPYSRIHLKIYEKGGPDALFKYLKITHGSLKAMRYWMIHISNVQIVLTSSLLLYMSYDLWNTYSFWSSLQNADIDENADFETLHKAVEDLELSPNEFKMSLIENLKSTVTLRPEEQESVNAIIDILEKIPDIDLIE